MWEIGIGHFKFLILVRCFFFYVYNILIISVILMYNVKIEWTRRHYYYYIIQTEVDRILFCIYGEKVDSVRRTQHVTLDLFIKINIIMHVRLQRTYFYIIIIIITYTRINISLHQLYIIVYIYNNNFYG